VQSAPGPLDYGPLAATYDRLRPTDETWWELLELLVAEGDLLGRRVLDVGCGTGRVAAALAELGCRVWGVDPAEEMLREARAGAGPRAGFKQGRAEALPFKDGWFERAVLRLVVHLVDRPAAFGELVRVLAPGGRAVIATFVPSHFESYWLTDFFPDVAEIDRRRFPQPALLGEELESAGFSSIRTTPLEQSRTLSRAEALDRIRGRYISTLRLLDELAYADGLARAERELPDEVVARLRWAVIAADRAPG
jgi:SAM-dependent methyltransferase